MLPFGSDSTMLSPRYLTIVRGNYLVCLAAWAIVPWKIEASALIFTKFLSGYGIFMGSVASIMIVDYWLLTNGNVFIPSLYDPRPTNEHYYYCKGWNLQACLAYICGIALPLPGFLGTLGVSVPLVATHLNELGWLLSFFVAGTVYFGICKIWPTKNQRLIKDLGLGWQEMSLRGEEVEVLEGIESREGGLVKGGLQSKGDEKIVVPDILVTGK